MLVPLGSWCRTAYQVRQFVQNAGFRRQAYPFDWTITPFSALRTTLDPRFQPARRIHFDNLALSKLGSALDRETGLIHHHDLPAAVLKALARDGDVNGEGVPLALKHRHLRQISGRRRHAFGNLNRLKRYPHKIGFVRWIRFGHPDFNIPDVFEGEEPENVADILHRFLGHENFALLHVKTERVDNCDFDPLDVISSYCTEAYGARASIRERQGFNGDGTDGYMGDTVPWQTVLGRFADEQGLRPVSRTYDILRGDFPGWR